MEEDSNLKKELITAYSQLPVIEKRRELAKEIVETTLCVQQFDNNQSHQKNSEDFMAMIKSTKNEDEFLTQLYGNIIDMKEIIASHYLNTNNFDGGFQKTLFKDGYSNIVLIIMVTAIVTLGIMLGILLMR